MTRHHLALAAMIAGLSLVSEASAVPIPPNVRVSQHQPGLQNEEQVMICPDDTTRVFTNHRDFRLGYRQIGLGRSTDGGATWTDSLMSLSHQIFNRQSDPIMTVTSSGNYIIGHLDYQDNSSTGLSYIAFLISEDCGVTWSGPWTVEQEVGDYFEDKQFVTSDMTGGAYDGNVYVSWTRFPFFGSTQIMFSRSTFGGISWDDPITVGSAYFTTCFGTVEPGQLSQPLVGKDGSVYVFWQGTEVKSSPCQFFDAIRVNKSTDGGVTWQGERIVRRVSAWSYTPSGIDIYSQPTTACDITNGPHGGNLYLQYRDTLSPFGSEIMFQRSLDTGHTWSAPARIVDWGNVCAPVANGEQFHNWLVCNEEGILVSIWYDERTDPPGGTALFDVFAAYSFDGGETWTSNHRISSVSINTGLLTANKAEIQEKSAVTLSGMTSPLSPQTPLAGLIAEYIGVSCVWDKVVAVWTDTRDGDQDVYAAHWYLFVTDPRLLSPICGELIDRTAPGLSWATAWKENEDSYDLEIDDDPAFGAPEFTAQTTDNSFNDPLPIVPGGTFYWRIRAHGPDEMTGWSSAGSFMLTPPPCACDCHADPACDNATDVLDVVNVVNVAFRGFPAIPDPNGLCPYETTDTDCNGATDVVDVVHMVNVAFRSAEAAAEFCDPCA